MGRVLADNEKQAVELLKMQECFVISLHELSVFSYNYEMPRNKFLRQAEFACKLAQFTRAGIPILKSLRILQNNSDAKLKVALTNVDRRINEGLPLSRSLIAEKHLFSSFFVEMVEVGEHAGILDKILNDLSGYYFACNAFYIKIKQVVMYPLFLVCLMLIVMSFFIWHVVPLFNSLYALFNISPGNTLKIFMYIRGYALAVVGTLLGAMIAAGIIFFRYKAEVLANLYTKLFAHLKVSCLWQEVCFCRVLGMLLAAGVDLLSALKLAGNILFTIELKNDIENVREEILNGLPLYVALKLNNRFLSYASLEFISIGEESGGLDTMLHLAAEQAEQNLNVHIEMLKTYIQPVCLLVVGVVMAAVIIILLQPMLGLIMDMPDNF